MLPYIFSIASGSISAGNQDTAGSTEHAHVAPTGNSRLLAHTIAEPEAIYHSGPYNTSHDTLNAALNASKRSSRDFNAGSAYECSLRPSSALEHGASFREPGSRTLLENAIDHRRSSAPKYTRRSHL